jgi:aspartate/tyrosine/aromatic aminotransferase
MASFEEELLQDEEENRRELEYMREQLPTDLKQKYSDDDLLFIIDAIGTYFYTSGILESNSDEVDIDMETVSDFVCNKAKEEGIGPFKPEEVFFVVEADLDFQEQES